MNNPSPALGALALATLVLLTVGLTACGMAGSADTETDGVPSASFDRAAPEGFRVDWLGEVPYDDVAALMEGRTEPLSTTVAVYVSEAEPGLRITTTLATYPTYAGALAMYNRWFADYGFIPAAERRPVPLGDQAECFDVGWPSFHAVVLRQGPLFALVQADRAVPIDRCAALLEDLLPEVSRQ